MRLVLAGVLSMLVLVPSARAATVSGQITANGGGAVAGARPYLQLTEAPFSQYRPPLTGADGNYTIPGVPAGTYKLILGKFELADPDNYAPQYYDGDPSGTLSYEEAGDVVLESADDATGYDAALLPGGQVSGKVTDELGNPAADVSVQILPRDPLVDFANFQTTGADGTYVARFLPLSSFSAHFVPATGSPLKEQWWKNTTEAGKTPIDLSPSILTVAGIDAALAGRLKEPTPDPTPPQEETTTPSGGTTTVPVVTPPAGVVVEAPSLSSSKPLTLKGSTATVPLACPSGCSVTASALPAAKASAAAKRKKAKPIVIATGKAKAGAKRVKLTFNRRGRALVKRGQVRVTLKVKPGKGKTRSFKVKVKPAAKR